MVCEHIFMVIFTIVYALTWGYRYWLVYWLHESKMSSIAEFPANYSSALGSYFSSLKILFFSSRPHLDDDIKDNVMMSVFKPHDWSFILQNKILPLVENNSRDDLQTHWAPKDGVNQPVNIVESASQCINIKSGAFCVNNMSGNISNLWAMA